MKGTIFAFMAIALFSLYTIFGKILLSSVSPLTILILNQFLAGLILILILDLFKKIQDVKIASKHDFKIMYSISIFTAVIGPILFLTGLKMTTATNAILIGKSEAVITTILAIFFLKDKITWHRLIGAVIMFFGIAIIATNTFSLDVSLNPGDALIFVSALSYGIGTVLFKRYSHHIPPGVIVSLRNLFGATTLFIVSFFFMDYTSLMSALSLKFVLAMLGLVVLTTIIGQFLWYKALEMTDATNVSMAGLSSPLIAVFYAVIFLGESINRSQIIGGICIIIGLIIIEFHFKKVHTKKKHRRHLKLKHWPHV